MDILSAKQQIKDTVEAYLTTDDAGMYIISTAHQRPMFLLGAPGIGKTAIMEQVASELGIGIVSYSMTHHTRQSALGLPQIEHRCFEGFEYDASEYTMSEIIAAIYDYMERTDLRQGILFLDEINCVSETLYPSMLQFLQFKIFGKHKVPDGWVVVCAGNPPEYNRSVHEFDIVTLDRLRVIDVEPDYTAWKSYATEMELHAAVTTFLETKKECFYLVESKPGGGKLFVTARGWEDLARIISLYEYLGKPINRDLIAQFLRDDDIADQFAVYYALYEKYRSDYQIDSILAGKVSSDIKARADQAAFDERIALIGLLLDALSGECSGVLDREGVVIEIRDVLREAKPEFLDGATVADALGKRIADREFELNKRIASGVAPNAFIRKEHLVISQLRELASLCTLEGTEEGEEAFRTIEAAYKAKVAEIQPAADAANEKINAAFDFIDECFTSREMLVFMAEIATRKTTTQFIAHYGNTRYYEHNEQLQVDSARMGLAERAELLAELDENIKLADTLPVGMGSAAALSLDDPASSDKQSKDQGGQEKKGRQDSQAGKDASSSADDLKKHYAGKQFEYGFTSVCKMLLPTEQLKGKRVLDICCRRGRGAYKLSSMVGDEGSVVGVDWNAAYIEEAKDGMERAWHDSHLKGNNMEFLVAYPEDLIAAGIGTQTMDAVYVNNVITLFHDQEKAIEEIGRVLRPGGLLILETIFADQPRNDDIVDQARSLGNSVQAARTKEENYAWLEAAGFDEPSIEESYDVDASRGYKADSTVEIVEGDDDVAYTAVSLYVRKK